MGFSWIAWDLWLHIPQRPNIYWIHWSAQPLHGLRVSTLLPLPCGIGRATPSSPFFHSESLNSSISMLLLSLRAIDSHLILSPSPGFGFRFIQRTKVAMQTKVLTKPGTEPIHLSLPAYTLYIHFDPPLVLPSLSWERPQILCHFSSFILALRLLNSWSDALSVFLSMPLPSALTGITSEPLPRSWLFHSSDPNLAWVDWVFLCGSSMDYILCIAEVASVANLDYYLTEWASLSSHLF